MVCKYNLRSARTSTRVNDSAAADRNHTADRFSISNEIVIEKTIPSELLAQSAASTINTSCGTTANSESTATNRCNPSTISSTPSRAKIAKGDEQQKQQQQTLSFSSSSSSLLCCPICASVFSSSSSVCVPSPDVISSPKTSYRICPQCEIMATQAVLRFDDDVDDDVDNNNNNNNNSHVDLDDHAFDMPTATPTATKTKTKTNTIMTPVNNSNNSNKNSVKRKMPPSRLHYLRSDAQHASPVTGKKKKRLNFHHDDDKSGSDNYDDDVLGDEEDWNDDDDDDDCGGGNDNDDQDDYASVSSTDNDIHSIAPKSIVPRKKMQKIKTCISSTGTTTAATTTTKNACSPVTCTVTIPTKTTTNCTRATTISISNGGLTTSTQHHPMGMVTPPPQTTTSTTTPTTRFSIPATGKPVRRKGYCMDCGFRFLLIEEWKIRCLQCHRRYQKQTEKLSASSSNRNSSRATTKTTKTTNATPPSRRKRKAGEEKGENGSISIDMNNVIDEDDDDDDDDDDDGTKDKNKQGECKTERTRICRMFTCTKATSNIRHEYCSKCYIDQKWIIEQQQKNPVGTTPMQQQQQIYTPDQLKTFHRKYPNLIDQIHNRPDHICIQCGSYAREHWKYQCHECYIKAPLPRFSNATIRSSISGTKY